ncbi:MAG TPA: HgcAB-associated protein [Methanoregulaceae archaeon]|nr:HgcAB-associated protein [Methanoregulaceae archaeon]
MRRKNQHPDLGAPDNSSGGCRMEAILAIDERGQMVIPKEVRDLARIRPGDRLALVSCRRDGEICCLMLIHNDRLTEMVKTVLSPVIKDIMVGNEVTEDVRK